MLKFILEKINDDLKDIRAGKYFKQININDRIRFTDRGWIKPCKVFLEINSLKLINTIEGTSLEGQNLSGKKLVLCGNVLILFRLRNRNKCCYIEKKIPLSNFIVVPKDIEWKDINLRYKIEDLTIVNIEYNLFFISVILYIEYMDNKCMKKQYKEEDNFDNN